MENLKEYLRKNNDGEYILEVTDEREAQEPHAKHWIEIPECSNIAVIEDSKVKFYSEYTSADLDHLGKHLIWMRHTHPEELPFIDDEPKIETATGYQLDVVGSNTYGSRSRYDGESDISYRQYLMNFIVGNRTESLNDQYAEIEKVRQSHRTASETSNPTIKETLNQRQSQYGSFEDVAQTTEQLFQVIKGGASFVDFTESQRMALYMIFSKVARLSNGDCNHKDSWHDIAGYATLIDEVL